MPLFKTGDRAKSLATGEVRVLEKSYEGGRPIK